MSRLASKVESILFTGTDQIDYGGAFDLIDMLNRNANSDRQIFDAISQISHNGDRIVRINTLQLIDAFFKNCNGQAIGRIVQNPVVLGLSDDFFTRDPRFHRTICGLSAEWMNIASKNRVLTQQFVNWQKDVCSFRYKYVMTEKVAKKFTTELTGCLELLMMFNRAMQTAMQTGARNDPLLDEILPNIHEIHVRIKELKPTISDKYVRDVISYIEEYCKLCKLAYSDFKQVGTCDLAGLNKIAAQGIPKREGQIKAADPLQAPAPAFQPPMPGQAPPSYDEAKNLIDFGSPQPAPAPAAAQPSQMSAPSFEPPMPAPSFAPPMPAPSFEPPMPAPSFEPPMPQQSPFFAPPQVPGDNSSSPSQQQQQNLFAPPVQQSYQPPQPEAQNPFLPPPQQQPSYQPQPAQQQNPFLPQQGTFQPPMQQGYGMAQQAPQAPGGMEAVDDDTVPNDEFMDFLQNISTKR